MPVASEPQFYSLGAGVLRLCNLAPPPLSVERPKSRLCLRCTREKLALRRQVVAAPAPRRNMKHVSMNPLLGASSRDSSRRCTRQ